LGDFADSEVILLAAGGVRFEAARQTEAVRQTETGHAGRCARIEEKMNRIFGGAGRATAKVGLGREPAMTPEERNGQIASLLTLVAIGFGSLGLWRMGTDLE